jgi:hypothetical protein
LFGGKDWVKGTATVASYQVITTSTRDSGPVQSLLEAQVVAQAEGIEPTPTVLKVRVSEARLPLADGYVFDVKINSKDPKEIKADEDNRKIIEELREKRAAGTEDGAAKAAQLAEEMRKGS